MREYEKLRVNDNINTIMDFLIVTFAIFLIIAQVSKMRTKTQEAPTTQECPHCFSSINRKATRCSHCTSVLDK